MGKKKQEQDFEQEEQQPGAIRVVKDKSKLHIPKNGDSPDTDSEDEGADLESREVSVSGMSSEAQVKIAKYLLEPEKGRLPERTVTPRHKFQDLVMIETVLATPIRWNLGSTDLHVESAADIFIEKRDRRALSVDGHLQEIALRIGEVQHENEQQGSMRMSAP